MQWDWLMKGWRNPTVRKTWATIFGLLANNLVTVIGRALI